MNRFAGIYNSEKELCEAAELVIIGSPVKSIIYEEPKIIYAESGFCLPNGSRTMTWCYTEREIKVTKILNGRYASETIYVAENAAYITDKELSPSPIIMNYDDFVMTENTDYILYMKKNLDSSHNAFLEIGYKLLEPGKFPVISNLEQQNTDENAKRIEEEVLEKYKYQISYNNWRKSESSA